MRGRFAVFALVVNGLILSSPVAAQPQSALLRDVEARLSYLEEQVRILTGKIEELSHTLKSTQPTSEGVGAPSSTSSSLTSQQQSKSSLTPLLSGKQASEKQAKDNTQNSEGMLPDGVPQQDYEKAITHLNRGEYAEAEMGFKSFISRYPKHPLVVNAHYWLGETWMAQSKYAEAAVSFAEAYQIYKQQLKKGSSKDQLKQSRAKAPEALIKLAFALKGIGKIEDACATLAQVKQEFPQLPHNLTKLAERARHGLRCR
jgi:tol-pal system protein YbgF